MSATSGRDVLITGAGLLSALGEGLDAHWAALNAAGGAVPPVDRKRFDPLSFHPLAGVDFDRQIPRRGDQRQMEPWQRIGTYAAGMALEDAGIKDDAAILAHTDMIVAAGGGERDSEVDATTLSAILRASDSDAALNEQLGNELRPTLFLAQLPNLLAGNISIVHKVTGSSRTFMGEEAAGVDAIRTAYARIASGQSEICLVGGSYNADRADLMLLFEAGGYLWHDDWRPVWDRLDRGGGIVPGSMGAFLVLESADHAARRGASAMARLAGVLSDRTRRRPGEAAEAAKRQLTALRPAAEGPLTVLSGATGAEPASSEERGLLAALAEDGGLVRAAGSAIGHGFEAQFPAQIILAALMARNGQACPSRDSTGLEAAAGPGVADILVTQWGHWRGEGMALVKPAG